MTYRAIYDLMADIDPQTRRDELPPAKDQKEYALRMAATVKAPDRRRRFDR